MCMITWCVDQDKVWQGKTHCRSSLMCKISSGRWRVWVWEPSKFEIWNTQLSCWFCNNFEMPIICSLYLQLLPCRAFCYWYMDHLNAGMLKGFCIPSDVESTLQCLLFLLRPRERLRSIVMSMSVCLSVCQDISGTTPAIFIKFFVHVAYVRGSVLLHHVDDKPHHLSAGRGWRECTAWVNCNLRLPCCFFCGGDVSW